MSSRRLAACPKSAKRAASKRGWCCRAWNRFRSRRHPACNRQFIIAASAALSKVAAENSGRLRQQLRSASRSGWMSIAATPGSVVPWPGDACRTRIKAAGRSRVPLLRVIASGTRPRCGNLNRALVTPVAIAPRIAREDRRGTSSAWHRPRRWGIRTAQTIPRRRKPDAARRRASRPPALRRRRCRGKRLRFAAFRLRP